MKFSRKIQNGKQNNRVTLLGFPKESMRKKWTMEQNLHGQNQRAKQVGARHDLTMEQWLETLEYFDHKCAYCGGEYQVIEHYLPVSTAGTTVSNCVPACLM